MDLSVTHRRAMPGFKHVKKGREVAKRMNFRPNMLFALFWQKTQYLVLTE
jgi:hypothetical protein